jgi:drug/metabolite transporter (DMT)-like permease
LNFGSLARLPVADVMAIYFCSPLVTVALSALILREQVRIYRWSAVVVGLFGVMLTLAPHLSFGQTGALSAAAALGCLLAVLCAVFDAGAAIQVRRLTSSESTASIVIYFSLICMLAGLCTLPFGWVWPTGRELAVLCLIGLLGGISPSLSDRELPSRAGFSHRALRLCGDPLGYRLRLYDVW